MKLGTLIKIVVFVGFIVAPATAQQQGVTPPTQALSQATPSRPSLQELFNPPASAQVAPTQATPAALAPTAAAFAELQTELEAAEEKIDNLADQVKEAVQGRAAAEAAVNCFLLPIPANRPGCFLVEVVGSYPTTWAGKKAMAQVQKALEQPAPQPVVQPTQRDLFRDVLRELQFPSGQAQQQRVTQRGRTNKKVCR